MEAEEVLRTALLAQTSILEDVEEMRIRAEAEAAATLEELRAERENLSSEKQDAGEQESIESDQVVAARITEAETKARKAAEAKGKAMLKKARKRAGAAESRVADLETERDRLATTVEELRASADAEIESAGADEVDRAELDELRRQVAQMRTALSNIQSRFAGAAKLSPEELELATALVDLDMHDVDLLVDLTTPAMTQPEAEVGHVATVDEEQPGDDVVADAPAEDGDEAVQPQVTIKSKWAQAGAVPAGSLREGRSEAESGGIWPDIEAPSPNWRDSFGSTRKAAAKAASEAKEEEPLGFYERRLAGLKERLRDAGND